MIHILKIILVLFALSSCMKKLDKSIDYGPEIQADVISKSINDSYGTFDPTTIKVNDYISYYIYQQINNTQPKLITEEAYQVLTKVNEPREIDGEMVEGFKFRLRFQTIDHTKNPPAYQVTDGREIFVEAHPPTAIASMRAFSEEAKKNRITYHNFKSQWMNIIPPDSVQKSENCGGIPNCLLRTHELQFDKVTWEENAAPKKLKVISRAAPDLPFIARLLDGSYIPYLSYCLQFSTQYNKQAVLVTQCREINNFMFGTTTP